MFDTQHLASLRLPQDAPARRQSVLAPDAQPADFAERYDDRTLAYAAVHQPQRRRILLICPKLLNLAPLLRKAPLTSDAGSHKIRRIRAFRRYDEVILDARSGAGPSLNTPWGPLPITPPQHRFKGGHLLLTISKDNPLHWVKDWAAHMVATQGTTHALIFDNGSTAYGPEDLSDCLASVPGLQGALVVSAPLPYGPTGTKPPRGKGLFLQTGLLNLARLIYAPAAQTVTCCDVDELLVSAPEHGRLIDAAQASRLGYATATCHWRYAEDPQGDQGFGDHLLRRDPNGTSKEKWCLVPGGPLGGTAWDIHGVAGYRWNRLVLQRHHWFYHCADITTGWKRRQGTGDLHRLVEDPETRANLERLGLR